MHHFTLSKREWLNRFAVQLVRAVPTEVTLDQALDQARRHYEFAFDASPELAAYRLLGGGPPNALKLDAACQAHAAIHKARATAPGPGRHCP